MLVIEADFEALLQGWDRSAIDDSSDSIIGLSRDLSIGYLNSGWFLFAKHNGAHAEIQANWPLGRCLLDAISGTLKEIYARNLVSALEAPQPWHHDYECSSPSEYRRFHSIAYPLQRGQGLLMVHSLAESRPFDSGGRPPEPDVAVYLDENGNLHQCGHCRRMRRIQSVEQWDWVPRWVERCPPNTSHGLCSTCLDFYYPPGE